MKTNRSFSHWVFVTLLLLAPAAFAQAGQKNACTPLGSEDVQCEPGRCGSKVFSSPSFSTPYELQDVVNAFRIIVQTSTVSSNPSEHTISLQGTPQQLAISEKLVTVLESLKSSGGRDKSSVLVYEPLPGKVLEHSSGGALERCGLTNCFIKALYLPDYSIVQLQDAVNKLHFTAHIARICMVPSSHTIIFQATTDQLALAEGLVKN